MHALEKLTDLVLAVSSNTIGVGVYVLEGGALAVHVQLFLDVICVDGPDQPLLGLALQDRPDREVSICLCEIVRSRTSLRAERSYRCSSRGTKMVQYSAEASGLLVKILCVSINSSLLLEWNALRSFLLWSSHLVGIDSDWVSGRSLKVGVGQGWRAVLVVGYIDRTE